MNAFLIAIIVILGSFCITVIADLVTKRSLRDPSRFPHTKWMINNLSPCHPLRIEQDLECIRRNRHVWFPVLVYQVSIFMVGMAIGPALLAMLVVDLCCLSKTKRPPADTAAE